MQNDSCKGRRRRRSLCSVVPCRRHVQNIPFAFHSSSSSPPPSSSLSSASASAPTSPPDLIGHLNYGANGAPLFFLSLHSPLKTSPSALLWMLKQKWCWLCWEKEKQDGAKTVCVLYIESERQRQRQWQRQWQRVCVMLALIRYDDAFKPVEHQGMRRARQTGIATKHTGVPNKLFTFTHFLSFPQLCIIIIIISGESRVSSAQKEKYRKTLRVYKLANWAGHWRGINEWLTDWMSKRGCAND